MDGGRRARHHGRVTHGRLPRRTAYRAATFLVVLLAPLLIAAELADRSPPVAVSVDGWTIFLDRGTTFGGAIGSLGLDPEPGRLLDVRGGVLERRVDPGAILLNGAEAPASTVLADGDTIAVVDGEDRTEAVRRETERLPGRQPDNPMYTLSTSRMVRITTLGRVSGTVVSVRYRTLGGTRPPAAVALTFDDGPWPRSTTRVLEVLRWMRAPATFFMIGYLAERYPGIVRRVARAGMTIGVHSWSHPVAMRFDRLTPHRIQTELERPATLIERTIGTRPTLFRPPGGHHGRPVVDLADAAGMRVVQWSVDPHDYRADATAAEIAGSVLGAVRPGSIVLLHDGGGNRSATIRALPRIIRGIRAMGLRLVAIPT